MHGNQEMNINIQNVKQYKLINSKGVHVNTIMLSDDSDWEIPEGFTLELLEIPQPQKIPILELTQLEFLRRFTSQERIAAKTSADPVIEDFMYLLTLAQNIRLDDPDTIAGVNYLEQQGILAEGRATEILTPELK